LVVQLALTPGGELGCRDRHPYIARANRIEDDDEMIRTIVGGTLTP